MRAVISDDAKRDIRRAARFQEEWREGRGETFARLILQRHVPFIVKTALEHMVYLHDEEGGPPLRRFRVLTPGFTTYSIYYRVFDDAPEVDIVAVLDGREDVDSMLSERVDAPRPPPAHER